MLTLVCLESVNVRSLSILQFSVVVIANLRFYRKRHYPTVSVFRRTEPRRQLTETQSGALMARMVVTSPEYTKSKYNLPQLKMIEEYVASVVQVNIPVSTLKHHIIKKRKKKLMLP